MTKKCPFCAEDIQQDAIKCRFCGSMLDGSTATPSMDLVDIEARRIVSADGKIAAIKYIRKQKGLDLAAAKSYVERLEPGGAPIVPGGPGCAVVGLLLVLFVSLLIWQCHGHSGAPVGQ